MDFNEICRKIKEVKIQGARNIAKAALIAYSLKHTKSAKKKLIGLRPTEPMLVNVLNMADKMPEERILRHFDDAQDKINKLVFKIIKNNSRILTHCHSTNVVNALIYAKKHGKKFEIFNTETRPLFQGHKTAKELSKAKIKVTMIADNAVGSIIQTEKIDAFVIGADALLKNGDVINKIGSNMFAEIAYDNKVPVYIIADSWKFSKRNVGIEQREHKEIWKKAPKHIQIQNPAFETVKSKYIAAIVSELGMLKPKAFVKKFKRK
jgi:ribose 1,5-bisphosphate isomerase